MRKPKRRARSNAQLARELREAHEERQRWMMRHNDVSSRNLDMAADLERAEKQYLSREVEIGRLQGYIDRVFDEDSERRGAAPKGPDINPLNRLRENVIYGRQPLDEMTQDEIERLTGRDD